MAVADSIQVLLMLAVVTATCLSITATTTPSASLSHTLSHTVSSTTSHSSSWTASPSITTTGSVSVSATNTVRGSRSTLSSSNSMGITASFSAHVSRSTRTPSMSIGSTSPTFSKRYTPSSRSVTQSMMVSATASNHVSRSTPSRSVSVRSQSQTGSKHVSRSTKTGSTSASPSRASETLRATESRELSPTRPLSETHSFSVWSHTRAVTTSPTTSASAMDTPSTTASVKPSASPTLHPTPTGVATRTQSIAATATHLSDTASQTAQCSHTLSVALNSTSRSLSSVGTRTSSPQATASHPVPRSASVEVTASLTRDLPPPGAPCEYPAVTILPSGETISDEMVRTQPIVFWLNLSSPFRWRLDAPGMVSAKSVSTGSQPERLGWGTTVNLTCGLAGKEHMRCTVPATPAYLLLVEETVELTVPTAAYEGVCTAIGGRLLVASVFIAADTPIKLKAARALSALIGVEGFLASWFGSQAMVYDGHLMAMVGQMSCASTLDDYMTMRLMYLVAPMTDYGPFAVAYFNMFLLGAFLVVHLALTLLLSQRKGILFNDAAEMSAFPGWSYCCAVALHSGICYGTMQIAFNSSGPVTASASAGGFLYIVVIFAVLFYVLRRFANVAFVEYGKVRSRPPLQRFFLPSGYWDPKQPRRMFGRMLVTVGAGRMMYVPYQMLLLTGFSVITSARPTTLSGCRTLFFVMGGGLVLAASQVAWWRPHRVPLQNATTVCTMLLLAIQCCLQAPSSADVTVDLDDAKAAMWLVQMVVVALRGIFDTFLVVWENFRWGKDREPLFGVLDEDHFATEDHSIEVSDAYYLDDGLPPTMLAEGGGGPTNPAALASVSSEVKRQRRLSIRSSSVSFAPASPSPSSPSKEAPSAFSPSATVGVASAGAQRNGMLAPRHSLSLGRWEGSEGSLSSDDIL